MRALFVNRIGPLAVAHQHAQGAQFDRCFRSAQTAIANGVL